MPEALSAMEPADALIRRQLPSLTRTSGTSLSTAGSDRSGGGISTGCFDGWMSFRADVLSTYSGLDLSALVLISDDQDGSECFVFEDKLCLVIEDKLCLVTRFVKPVCDAVSKAMAVVPELSHLAFGTYKAAVPASGEQAPDIVLLATPG